MPAADVEIVRAGRDRKAAAAYIATCTKAHIDAPDRERFHEIGESELLRLHECNFARYQLRPSEFPAWRGGADQGQHCKIVSLLPRRHR